MCLSPIILPNRVKSRYGGLEYNLVPCRNCPECAQQMADDYLCRAIALWNSLPDYYNVYFCTLTFNNENLPRTNVYELNETGEYWNVVKSGVPCFNHQIYQRFRKNFSEFISDVYHEKCYFLTTCEYGRKYGRPHYHCLCFVPYYNSWKDFKYDFERFWHYGFTKNIRIVVKDGETYLRGLFQSIKYITKYVCKYNQNLPFYLRGDFVTDFPPSDVKPRVFTSNGFGSALENTLTDLNYKYNNIYLSIKGDKQKNGKSFLLPSYYRRRKFIKTEIIYNNVDKNYWSDYLREHMNKNMPILPYLPKVLNRPKVERKSITYRHPLYCKYLFDDFKKGIKQKLFDFDNMVKNNDDFRLRLLEKFDKVSIDFKSVYNNFVHRYLERSELPLSYFFDSERPSSLSPSLSLPYINMVENKTKTHYLKPSGYFDSAFRSWFRYQQYLIKKHSLLWADPARLPAIYFRTCKYVQFTLPHEDIALLDYMDKYKREYRYKQYRIQHTKDIEWYKTHIEPFQDVA